MSSARIYGSAIEKVGRNGVEDAAALGLLDSPRRELSQKVLGPLEVTRIVYVHIDLFRYG
jgi:hypothetical protein